MSSSSNIIFSIDQKIITDQFVASTINIAGNKCLVVNDKENDNWNANLTEFVYDRVLYKFNSKSNVSGVNFYIFEASGKFEGNKCYITLEEMNQITVDVAELLTKKYSIDGFQFQECMYGLRMKLHELFHFISVETTEKLDRVNWREFSKTLP